MANNFIAAVLKTKRKDQNLSVKDTLDKLQSFGINISAKTLYGWESGHRQPDADTFLVLCRIYGINEISGIQKIPPLEKKAPSLSDEAMEVGVAYDVADTGTKGSVRKLLDLDRPRPNAKSSTSYKPFLNDEEIEAELAEYRRELEDEKRAAADLPASNDAKNA